MHLCAMLNGEAALLVSGDKVQMACNYREDIFGVVL